MKYNNTYKIITIRVEGGDEVADRIKGIPWRAENHDELIHSIETLFKTRILHMEYCIN